MEVQKLFGIYDKDKKRILDPVYEDDKQAMESLELVIIDSFVMSYNDYQQRFKYLTTKIEILKSREELIKEEPKQETKKSKGRSKKMIKTDEMEIDDDDVSLCNYYEKQKIEDEKIEDLQNELDSLKTRVNNRYEALTMARDRFMLVSFSLV